MLQVWNTTLPGYQPNWNILLTLCIMHTFSMIQGGPQEGTTVPITGFVVQKSLLGK
jgi:hypothetical protein